MFFFPAYPSARTQRKTFRAFRATLVKAKTTAEQVPRGAIKAFFEKATVRAIVPEHLHLRQATLVAEQLGIEHKTIWAEVWHQQQQQQQNRFTALANDDGEDEDEGAGDEEDGDNNNDDEHMDEDEATVAGSSSSSSNAPTSSSSSSAAAAAAAATTTTTAAAPAAPATTAAKAPKPRMRVATVCSVNQKEVLWANLEHAFTTQTTLEHIRHPSVPMHVLRPLMDAIAADNDAIYDEVCAHTEDDKR